MTIVLKSLRDSWGVVQVPTILRPVISYHQLWEVFLDLQTKYHDNEILHLMFSKCKIRGLSKLIFWRYTYVSKLDFQGLLQIHNAVFLMP